MALHQETCVACRGDATPLTPHEIEELLPAVPDLTVTRRDNVEQLERVHQCRDFAAALALANRIGALADAEDHHPELTVEWGRLTIRYWTHTLRGLHRNDFVMAARTSRLIENA